MEDFLYGILIIVSLIVGVWIVSGLLTNWFWSGNPFGSKKATENIKTIIEGVLTKK